MNSFEKETIQAQLKDEEKALQDLEKAYKHAKKTCQQKLKDLNARTDMQNLQSIIHQKKYQEQLLKQIDGVLDDLQNHTYKTANDFFQGSYQNGYIGSMYELQKQGIPMTIPVSTKKMMTAIQTNSKLSSNYYLKKGLTVQNIRTLKKQIALEATRGIASGQSWLDVAQSLTIQRYFDIDMSDAMRIVRTEGNRINQQGRLDAGDEAVQNGCDLLKQWDATLDSRTREAHREADGQIVEWDEEFTVGGEKMKAPSIGGSAKNVINCRCQLLKRPRWSLDEEELETLKKRAEFYGLDKTKSFDEYKDKFLKASETLEDQLKKAQDNFQKAKNEYNDLKKKRNDLENKEHDIQLDIDAGRKVGYSRYDKYETQTDLINDLHKVSDELDEEYQKMDRWLEENPRPTRDMFHLDDDLPDDLYEKWYDDYRQARKDWKYVKDSYEQEVRKRIAELQTKLSELREGRTYWSAIQRYREAQKIGLDVLEARKKEIGKELTKVLSDMLDKQKDINDLKKAVLDFENAIKHRNILSAYASGKIDVRQTTQKIKKVMSEVDYDEYVKIVNDNPKIAKLYTYADEIGSVTYKKGSGCCWGKAALEFGYPDKTYIDAGMSKFSTIAHEYGHFFDTLTFGKKIDGITFEEYEGLQKVLKKSGYIVASSSDQFLAAMRNDAKRIEAELEKVKSYCIKRKHTTTGIQDAVDGLGLGRIWWGHGDKYYNRFYNNVVKGGQWGNDHSKELKDYYKSLGFDVSNQTKVKRITRQYETASELWANISSAVTCGGEELETMKEYFPEAVDAFIEITGKMV